MRIANCYLFDLHICADNLEIVDRTATASEPDDGHPGNPHRRRPTTPPIESTAQNAAMVRKLRAARVLQATTELLATKHTVKGRPPPGVPAWYQAVKSIPPAEVLTRPYPPQHRPFNPRQKKPLNVYRPTELVYPEDELRQDFYRDHPWELARPMMVLELDGEDARQRDWSRGVEQPGMRLSGERYVWVSVRGVVERG